MTRENPDTRIEIRLEDRLRQSDAPQRESAKNSLVALIGALFSALVSVLVSSFSFLKEAHSAALNKNLFIVVGIATGFVILVTVVSYRLLAHDSSEPAQLKNQVINTYISALKNSNLNPSSSR